MTNSFCMLQRANDIVYTRYIMKLEGHSCPHPATLPRTAHLVGNGYFEAAMIFPNSKAEGHLLSGCRRGDTSDGAAPPRTAQIHSRARHHQAGHLATDYCVQRFTLGTTSQQNIGARNAFGKDSNLGTACKFASGILSSAGGLYDYRTLDTTLQALRGRSHLVWDERQRCSGGSRCVIDLSMATLVQELLLEKGVDGEVGSEWVWVVGSSWGGGGGEEAKSRADKEGHDVFWRGTAIYPTGDVNPDVPHRLSNGSMYP